MSFREFKKTTLKYFLQHAVVKKRLIKKGLKYNIFKTIIGNFYNVIFEFNNYIIKLNYFDKMWELTLPRNYEVLVLNLGETIEECCDYLWKKEQLNNAIKQ